jgi:peptidoglycan L-alanyl-D-glutamate endopeptidase CwlK
MEGIDPDLRAVVERAIELTKIDFGVSCGLRTVEEQRELVFSGASQTMDSKHLDGKAVDLVAYIGTRVCWEINVYDDIADAMAQAARELGVKGLRWGGSWTTHDIADCGMSMEEAMNQYIDIRRAANKRPFIDGPHFEIL